MASSHPPILFDCFHFCSKVACFWLLLFSSSSPFPLVFLLCVPWEKNHFSSTSIVKHEQNVIMGSCFLLRNGLTSILSSQIHHFACFSFLFRRIQLDWFIVIYLGQNSSLSVGWMNFILHCSVFRLVLACQVQLPENKKESQLGYMSMKHIFFWCDPNLNQILCPSMCKW